MIRLRHFLPVLFALLTGCAGLSQQQTSSVDSSVADAPSLNAVGGAYIAKDTSRTVDLTQPATDVWQRIRRGFAVPDLHSPLVDQWTDFYASHPEYVQAMAQRAGKYLYYIVDEINRRHLPTELALLPFIESAYNPDALSPAQASGLWQFVPTTGEHYNLQQTWWRDQRRDPIASTQAALDYLGYLYKMQGDWFLALSSYNLGEGAIQRAMAKNQADGLPTDYLNLSLPDETRNYVPKLQAIKNIISDPAKYAIVLPEIKNQPYFARVQSTHNIDVAVAAKLAEMPVSEFKALNPSYNRPVILMRASDDETTDLLLPIDKVAVFEDNLRNYSGQLSAWETYQARRGESYSQIARRYGISLARLREINHIPPRHYRAIAQMLLVPRREAGGVTYAAYDASDSDPMRTTTRAPQHIRLHVVRKGDTLFSIAHDFGISVAALKDLNNLRGNGLHIGQRLRIPGTDSRG